MHSPTPTLPTEPHSKPDALSHPVKTEEQWIAGTGSQEDPYVVGWTEGEAADPYNWSKFRK